jgi:hypothetical protein
MSEYYGGLLGPEIKCIKLNDTFVRSFRSIKPPFGFNGLGEIVYLRTYAREKDDGSCEEWVDTVERVVNGAIEILQLHVINKLHTTWSLEQINDIAEDMFIRIFEMKFLPPGRSLWAMGSPIIRKKGFAAALNNCAFVSTNDLQHDKVSPFLFLMDASMLGVGVGFDTKGAGSFVIPGPSDYDSNKNISKENISKENISKENISNSIHVISDDREGWVESVKILLMAYFENKPCPTFDYSRIRELGTKLKTFGGTSSGPGPLITLHKNIKKCLENEINKPISVTCITDIMNMIGVCTVSGNIRRCIPKNSLVHTSDGLVKIQDIKVGDFVQTISGYEKVIAFYEQGIQKIWNIETEHGVFRCTCNHNVAVKYNDTYTWISANKLKRGDKMIISRFPLNGHNTHIVINGDKSSNSGNSSNSSNSGNYVYISGNLAWFIGVVMTIHLSGRSIDESNLIKNYISNYTHEKYTISKIIIQSLYDNFILTNKDGYLSYDYVIPNYIRQSTLKNRFHFIIGTINATEECRAASSTKSTESTSTESTESTESTDILISDVKCMTWLSQLQTLCYSCGFETELGKYTLVANSNYSTNFIKDVILSNMRPTTIKKLCIDNLIKYSDVIKKFHYSTVIDVYESDTEDFTYDISVDKLCQFYCNGYLVHNSAEIAFGQPDCKEFLDLKSYETNPQRQEYGWASNNSIFATIGMDYSEACKRVAINGEPGFAWLDNMKSYSRMNGQIDDLDFRVSGGNPCLEQSLESMELCNLVECFPTKHENIEDFLQTLKIAFMFAKIVTLLPVHWQKTNEIMMRNRRIGCSVSGIAQFITEHGIDVLKNWLETGYDFLKQNDKEISELLCIRQSIKITSVKPSGTVSLLAGVTPGIHYPESNYYIRRMRIARNSPLITRLLKAGYHIEPCVTCPDTTLIVEFPVAMSIKKYENMRNMRTLNDVSMWEQLSLAAFMQRYWADNQVSCTVTFNKNESSQIEYALNYFQYLLKGISFLPRLDSGNAYKQLPYESISKEQYEVMNSKINHNIKLSKDAVSTATDSDHMTFCDNDKCHK